MSFGAVLAIVTILAETFRADRAALQNRANARENTRRQAAQNVVMFISHVDSKCSCLEVVCLAKMKRRKKGPEGEEEMIGVNRSSRGIPNLFKSE